MGSRTRHALGIDPGTNFCGWALVEGGGDLGAGRFKPLGLGTIVLPEKMPLHRRLGQLLTELAPIVDRAHDLGAEAAVERPFCNKNHMATLGIAGARGLALGLIGAAALSFHEYSPQVWKMITGHGGADKLRVAAVVKALLGLREDPPLDAADAAAIAIYHLSTR
jgi:crossover junction endodeoxyribonuclease RuvC